MKKIILLGVVTLVLLVAIAVYFSGLVPGISQSLVVPADLPALNTPPAVTIVGKVMVVPELSGATTSLDFLSPTARRDYPMGRYTAEAGLVTGTLVAIDEYLTPFENNRRALPIAVTKGGADTFYYLAILEGEDWRHATSVYLGKQIKVTGVSRTGDQVTVTYFVHDRNQSPDEVPLIATTAIVDISTATMVQAGRNPSNETVVVVKNFVGKYLWIETSDASGVKITPFVDDKFYLTFDANRLILETDCNTGGATFVAGSGSSSAFTVDVIVATKMFCESNQESTYFKMVAGAKTYSEQSDGTLRLLLMDGGTMKFVPVTNKLEFENIAVPETASTS